MPSWTLKINQSVIKDLRDLPKDTRSRAALTTLELTTPPHPPGAEKLRGYEQTFRGGDYRIVYEVSEDEVVIVPVSHRKQVYRDLK